MISKTDLSETLVWRARAEQARRVASMLSPRDVAVVEIYARECEDFARASSIDGAKVNNLASIEPQRRVSQSLRSPAQSRLPNRAA